MKSDEFNFEIFSSLSEIYNVSIELGNNVKNIAFVKPAKVIGKNVVFRNVNKNDAEFILQLRTDPEKGKYLSATAADLDLQLAWLGKYADDNSQIYFIIEDKNGERYGTIRLYDVREDSFCWGSWILRDGRPSGFAMESAILVYQFALSLGFKKSHFDVRKENVSVWQFHERFGAVRIEEQGEDYIYSISHEAIKNSFEKYKKYINDEMEIYS
ncbi:GNAT family N-acetyltransferase [Janthinobacterium lividum]|uniref:GNAT family N-acetyltransferase n=1 Tax=Janthinobacterium lividum TaxID=29581 RepID=UPI00140C9586|nr:GNAT family N-acetyltransferase [Janthinobacterium lividum]NHQ89636.1 GNAT family N-acetyltransferase [Janthinobacterium lividum]